MPGKTHNLYVHLPSCGSLRLLALASILLLPFPFSLVARLRALVYSRTLRAIERSIDPPTALSDDLVPRVLAVVCAEWAQVDLVAFPRIVILVLVLLWNLITPVQTTDCATASTTESLETYFNADPQLSPTPDSGNLHPARCIIPQPSLLPTAPVLGNRTFRSPLEHTARPSAHRLRLWPRRQQTPHKPRNHYRDKEQ